MHFGLVHGIVDLPNQLGVEVFKMKRTKKQSLRKNQKQRDATFEKFKKQQNELNASRRGVRRK